jgi:acyl-CoA reductase-like NAD-dependent aldehyde dehydrogenase
VIARALTKLLSEILRSNGTECRADPVPCGGLKDSGLGKEAPRYAIREMTEEKMVVIH